MTGIKVYAQPEIAERLREELPGWSYDGESLRREFETDGWGTTLMLVNAIGYFAQVADHHPDLDVGWSRVVVRFSTHHAKGITAKDFEMATKVEEVALWHPRKSSALSGGARQLVKAAARGA